MFDSGMRVENVVNFVIENSSAYYFYNSQINPDGVYFLSDDNIDYWKLKTYIDAYNYHNTSKTLLQQIKDAISNLNISFNSETTNNQVNNSITQYDTNITQVYNVENNLSTDFNTYNQQFNPDFTLTLQEIQTAPQVMNGILTSLYDIKFIKYPMLLTLAGIVLLAFLGV